MLVVAGLVRDRRGGDVAEGCVQVQAERVGVGQRLEVDADVHLGDVGPVGGVGAQAARHVLLIHGALGLHQPATREAVLELGLRRRSGLVLLQGHA